LKTVANNYRLLAILTSFLEVPTLMTLSDLEIQKAGLVIFFALSYYGAYFRLHQNY